MSLCNTKDVYQHIDDDDILLHLVLAKFIVGLTRNQMYQCSFVMELMMKTRTEKRTVKMYLPKNHTRQIQKVIKYVLVYQWEKLNYIIVI